MPHLLLLQGPAGANKSQVAQRLLSGEDETDEGVLFGVLVWHLLADYTAIWSAITGAKRDPVTGLYPVRTLADAVVRSGIVNYLQRTVVRQGLRERLNVIITTATSGQEAAYALIAQELGAELDVHTIDPGRAVVESRLRAQNNGVLLDECRSALARWYG